MLDAIDIEERFQKALPLLLRQLEGLRLLKDAKRNALQSEKDLLPPGLREKGTIVLKNPRWRNREMDRRESDSEGDEIAELEEKIK